MEFQIEEFRISLPEIVETGHPVICGRIQLKDDFRDRVELRIECSAFRPSEYELNVQYHLVHYGLHTPDTIILQSEVEYYAIPDTKYVDKVQDDHWYIKSALATTWLDIKKNELPKIVYSGEPDKVIWRWIRFLRYQLINPSEGRHHLMQLLPKEGRTLIRLIECASHLHPIRMREYETRYNEVVYDQKDAGYMNEKWHIWLNVKHEHIERDF